MKVNKLTVVKDPAEVEFTGITLLSAEEYEACKTEVKTISVGWWWLKSPGCCRFYAKGVNSDGSLNNHVVQNVNGCVRPALQIKDLKSSGFEIGDRFEAGKRTWSIISNEFALCDTFVGQRAFYYGESDECSNEYESSDIKKWLAKWALDNGLIEDILKHNPDILEETHYHAYK